MKSINEWMNGRNISLNERMDPLDASIYINQNCPEAKKKFKELVALKGKMVDGCSTFGDLDKFKSSFAKASELIKKASDSCNDDFVKEYIEEHYWYTFCEGVYQVLEDSVRSRLGDPKQMAKWLEDVSKTAKWLIPALKG